MTREEALRELIDIRDEATAYPEAVCYVTAEDEDALNMAIEALKANTDGDIISRQDAIEAVWKLDKDANEYVVDDAKEIHGYCTAIGVCVGELSALPSAEPKTGEWIKATGMMPPEFHGHHCCSECGNFANMKPPFGNREDLSEFCPNCGARMKGADDE